LHLVGSSVLLYLIDDARSNTNQNIVVENGCNILQINPVRQGMNTKRYDAVIAITWKLNAIGSKYHIRLFSGENDQLFEKLGFSQYPFSY